MLIWLVFFLERRRRRHLHCHRGKSHRFCFHFSLLDEIQIRLQLSAIYRSDNIETFIFFAFSFQLFPEYFFEFFYFEPFLSTTAHRQIATRLTDFSYKYFCIEEQRYLCVLFRVRVHLEIVWKWKTQTMINCFVAIRQQQIYDSMIYNHCNVES